MNKNDTVLQIAIRHDMEVFKELKPRSKYSSITKNIVDYQKYMHKLASIKNDEEKERCSFDIDRSYIVASSKIKSLTPEQLDNYVSYLQDRYSKSGRREVFPRKRLCSCSESGSASGSERSFFS